MSTGKRRRLQNESIGDATVVHFTDKKILDEANIQEIGEELFALVEADDKRKARINTIHHLLSSVPYQQVQRPALVLPARPPGNGYQRPPRELFHHVPDYASTVVKASEKSKSRSK